MPAAHQDWIEAFSRDLTAGALDAALSRLRARATAHAGTPPAAAKRAAARAVRSAFPQPAALLSLAQTCLDHRDDTAVELAIMLLPHAFPTAPALVLAHLHDLADHPNWEVREYVADAVGAVLSEHWPAVLPVCREWVAEPSANLRRAVVVGTRYTARRRIADRAIPLLDLIEPALADRRPYVRKNLGPFALAGLLSAYPQETWARLHQWAAHPDEVVRWNVAMAMSAAPAGRRPQQALALLALLRSDERRFVQQAVATADRALRRKHPHLDSTDTNALPAEP